MNSKLFARGRAWLRGLAIAASEAAAGIGGPWLVGVCGAQLAALLAGVWLELAHRAELTRALAA